MITIQYLEDAPDLPARQTSAVIERLRAAAGRLPFSHLLIGWHLPAPMLEACRREAERLGLRFLRWHPLLTGDSVFQPSPDWQVVGATGRKVPGYRGLPEFTFVCPNHPRVREEITGRLKHLAGEGLYHGFFLDRLRFPSPSHNPVEDLGCFCEHCRGAASLTGLDLERVRKTVLNLGGTSWKRPSLVAGLLGGDMPDLDLESAALLRSFLEFREQSITGFLAEVSAPLRAAGMEIGLDCFSPGLTRMVGQNLGALSTRVGWIKVMSYAHTLGSAGIPYELLGLFDYLYESTGLDPSGILRSLGRTLGLELPEARRVMEKYGVSSSSLEAELRGGVQASSVPILAGFELVQIEGVAELNEVQILADLAAVKRAGAAGLAISWDLWDIPLERLELVRQVFLGNGNPRQEVPK